MDSFRNRCPYNASLAVGGLQAQDMGQEQAMVGLYSYVESA